MKGLLLGARDAGLALLFAFLIIGLPVSMNILIRDLSHLSTGETILRARSEAPETIVGQLLADSFVIGVQAGGAWLIARRWHLRHRRGKSDKEQY